MAFMVKSLSILIPVYNNECTALVRCLQQQCACIDGLCYEILVADDGSTNHDAICSNRSLNLLPGCRFIERTVNVGRAAIRNFLAQEAKGDFLLFLDSDVRIVGNDFILNYVACKHYKVVLGGYVLKPDNVNEVKGNLRYRYELSCLKKNNVSNRQLSPYKAFRTCNFMIERNLMLKLRFDERITRYGYEDVLFGKQLQAEGVQVLHIDNVVALHKFDTNAVFLRKTNEAMHTLHEMADAMRGYTGIQSLAERLNRWHVACFILFLYAPLSHYVQRNLMGMNPSVKLFHIYRLVTFLQYSCI